MVTCRPDTARPTLRTVSPGSPAAIGGLKPGDEWISVGGVPINSVDDFVSQIVRHAGGTNIELVVQRGNDRITTNATLDGKSSDVRAASESRVNVSAVRPSKFGVYSFGIPASDAGLTPEDMKRLRSQLQKVTDKLQRMPVAPPSPPVIRVERSNVEEKLDQLSERIRQLQEQVSRLADVVSEQSESDETE